jgi:hypothetical protein
MHFRNFSQGFTTRQLQLGLIGSILLTVATQAVMYYKLWQYLVCSFRIASTNTALVDACTLDFYKDIYASPAGWLLMAAQILAVASLVFFIDGYSRRKKHSK